MFTLPTIYCSQSGHSTSPLTTFCLQKDCQASTLACKICLFEIHSTHSPLLPFDLLLSKLTLEQKTSKTSESKPPLLQSLYSLIHQVQTPDCATELQTIGSYLRSQTSNLVHRLFSSPTDKLLFQILKIHGENPELTLRLCDKVLQIEKSCLPAYIVKAKIQRNPFKQYYNALSTCEECLQVAPECSEAHLQRGTMNLASETLKQYGEALKACDLALRFDPNNCEALVLKADIFYWKFMNKAEALKCFERIIQVNPKHDPAYIRQAVILRYDFQQYDLAEMCLFKALELDERSQEALVQLGELYLDTKQPEKALNVFERGLQLDRGNIEFLMKKGDLLFAVKDNDGAQECYAKVLDLSPRNTHAQSQLKRCRSSARQMQQQESALTTLIKL